MSVDMRKCFAVLILFFEKARQTIECVKSFLPSGVRICILNNGSSERNSRAVERFCALFDQITLFRSDVNLGVSAGRNLLIEKTDEEFLFLSITILLSKPATGWTLSWPQSARIPMPRPLHPECSMYGRTVFCLVSRLISSITGWSTGIYRNPTAAQARA